jgi:hypothetical protein
MISLIWSYAVFLRLIMGLGCEFARGLPRIGPKMKKIKAKRMFWNELKYIDN